MTFTLTKSRPLRVFGLYRSTGKHAAPRGTVPRPAALGPRRAAHAASSSRTTSARDSQAAQL